MEKGLVNFLQLRSQYALSFALKFWRPGASFITFPVTEQISPVISEAISRAMQAYGGVGQIKKFIRRGYGDEDPQNRFIVFNLAGIPSLFVMSSVPTNPISVRVAADCAISAREHLGPHFGACVLAPLEVGMSNGVFFAITSYCYPRNRWEIYRQRDELLNWLSEVARHTVLDSSSEETKREFEHPLLALSKYSEISNTVRTLVQLALVELNSEHWRPRLSLMHNDLHRGNILLSPKQAKHAYPFMIADWGGLRLAGNSINDLVHLALDLKFSPAQLAPYLKAHCEILECNPLSVKNYLFTSFGIFLLNPEICPYPDLAVALTKNLDYLNLTVTKIMEVNV
jgi:hypothetical protein